MSFSASRLPAEFLLYASRMHTFGSHALEVNLCWINLLLTLDRTCHTLGTRENDATIGLRVPRYISQPQICYML